ncbi:MAG: aldo/keto reductase [Rhodoblastus sp.]|nr:MAG: aldo/keto reductase [Rhodoblastus sp.]
MAFAPTVDAHGAQIPAIGLGTWRLAGEEAERAVLAALEAGYRHIDTAAMCDNEEALGRAIARGGVKRGEIWVTTKVWRTQWRRDALLASARASLDRLKLSQVDLLLIHWPDPAMILEETVDALNEAKALGLARHIGVSNFPPRLLRAAARAGAPLVVNQCEYHPMLDQSALLAECRAVGAAFVSYCPLGRGALLDDDVVATIAKAHGRTPAQVLLRWHVQQPGVVAIPRSRSPAHVAANLHVFDFELSADEMGRLFALARKGGRMVDPETAPRWDET